MSGTDFDYDVGTLSPEGRIFQVEYAEKAVENSSTIAGVVCKDGVLLATEKIVINKMMISGTDKRVYSVTKNIGSVIKLNPSNVETFIRISKRLLIRLINHILTIVQQVSLRIVNVNINHMLLHY